MSVSVLDPMTLRILAARRSRYAALTAAAVGAVSKLAKSDGRLVCGGT